VGVGDRRDDRDPEAESIRIPDAVGAEALEALEQALDLVCGDLLRAGATAIYAQTKAEPFVVPLYALIAAPAAGLVIGAIAGLYPALKAARLSPTEALRA
jgi:ABC-type lipoprotein release transport system permease subunit